MASEFFSVTTNHFTLNRTAAPSVPTKSLTLLRNTGSRVCALAKKWEPTKVVPQAGRVLIRLEQLPEKSAGGVLLPKAAVKFERYLNGLFLLVPRLVKLKLAKRFYSRTLMLMRWTWEGKTDIVSAEQASC